MERPLAYLKNLADDWLIGYDSRQFQHIAEELYLELTQLSECGKPPKIILAEPDPVRFLAGFVAACEASCPVFLCNPNWVKPEWQQVIDLVQPDVIWNGGMGGMGSREWGVGSREIVGSREWGVGSREVAGSREWGVGSREVAGEISSLLPLTSSSPHSPLPLFPQCTITPEGAPSSPVHHYPRGGSEFPSAPLPQRGPRVPQCTITPEGAPSSPFAMPHSPLPTPPISPVHHYPRGGPEFPSAPLPQRGPRVPQCTITPEGAPSSPLPMPLIPNASRFKSAQPPNALAPPWGPRVPHSPFIMIPTGGSSGQIKFAIHTWETLMASVGGFKEYFSLNQVNSFCLLPLYHVSGLMQFMRSFTTGGKLAILRSKEVESCQIYDIEPSQFFISLVPTQLQRFLQNPELTEWLSQFKTVLLGGAPAWNELLEKARYYKIPLAPTYGMTETASQIATLKPEEFLSGKVSAGKILPHAKVTIHNERGEVLPKNQIGKITIQAESLALGYYGLDFTSTEEAPPPSPTSQAEPGNQNRQDYLQVDDLGYLDDQGHLNIVGRSSDKIITGGENVYPTEIESAIRATGMVEDVCVIGIPDKFWGQAVTAIYIPTNSHTSTLEIQSLLKDKLTKFKIPKHWIPVSTLPRNPQGKINRQQLLLITINY